MKNIKDIVEKSIKNFRTSMIGTVTSILKSDKKAYVMLSDEEEIRDTKIISPYGYFSLPKGGEDGQLLFNNTSKNSSLIGVEHNNIPVDLQHGESIMYNETANTYIHLDNNGNINFKGKVIGKNNYVSIMDFGAKGDEIADDTAAIQTAINENAPKEIWVIIPEGNYKITAPLILKQGTRLLLNKNARLARYHNDSMFQNGVTGDTLGQSNIKVIGGKLDLRGHILNTSNSMDGSGFVLGYASNIQIRDVEIYNVFYSHGMELCALDNVFIEHCSFYGYKVDSGNTRNNVEAIQIERGTSLGFPYFGSGDNTISKNIYIHYCKFGASDVLPSWPTAIGTHQADTALTADNVEVIGCTTKNPLTYRATHFRGYKNVTFERNIMTATTGVTIYDDGVSVSKVRLRNNKITSTTNEAVHVEGVDGFSSDGNTLDGYTNALYLKATKNIKLGESDDYYGQTSDTLVILGSSAYMVSNGVTIRKSGRHSFNIYDGSNHIKILNSMILDVADNGNAFNLQGANTKIIQIRGNHVVDAVLNNVLGSTSGADRVFFNDNFYAASIVTPINSAATNSDTTGNHIF